MSHTLAELTSLHAQIMEETDVIWKRDWAARFEAVKDRDEYFQLVDELKTTAGAKWSDHLPGLINVYLIFAMDALRQKGSVVSL